MQTLTLLHSPTFPIARYADALTREAISSASVERLDSILATDASSLRVLLVDPAILDGKSLVVDARTAVVGIGLDEQPEWLTDDSIYLHLPESPSSPVLLSAIKRAFQ